MNKLSAQTGLLFSIQGTYQESSGFTGPIRMSYLNIPLLIGYEVIPRLQVLAGPQVGIFLDATFKDAVVDETIDLDHLVNRLDVSLVLGASYEVIDGLQAGLRYGFSLIDTHAASNRVGKHQVFQLTLIYDLSNQIFK